MIRKRRRMLKNSKKSTRYSLNTFLKYVVGVLLEWMRNEQITFLWCFYYQAYADKAKM